MKDLAGYYNYLLELGFHTPEEAARYSRLVQFLWSVPFRYSIAMDSNRVVDATQIRKDYSLTGSNCVQTIWDTEWIERSGLINTQCNFWEFIIGLAIRLDRMYTFKNADGYYDNDPNHNDCWYWVARMFENSNLIFLDNANFDPDEASRIVDLIMDRNYDFKGHGNIFTSEYTTNDMRELEYWWQLQIWFSEIFDKLEEDQSKIKSREDVQSELEWEAVQKHLEDK